MTHRDADGDGPIFVAIGWTAPAYPDGAVRRRHRLRRRGECRGDEARFGDRVHGRRHAVSPAGRPHDRVADGVVLVIGGTLMLMDFGFCRFPAVASSTGHRRRPSGTRPHWLAPPCGLKRNWTTRTHKLTEKKYMLVDALGSRELSAQRRPLRSPTRSRSKCSGSRHRQRQGRRAAGRRADGDRHHRTRSTTSACRRRLVRHRAVSSSSSPSSCSRSDTLSFAVGSYLGLPHRSRRFSAAASCAGRPSAGVKSQRRPRRKRRQSRVAVHSGLSRRRRRRDGAHRHRDQRPRRSGTGHQLMPPGVLAFGPRIAPGLATSNLFAVVMFALLA